MFPVRYPLIHHKNLHLTYPFLSIYRFTKPGGWVEFVDLDMKVYSSDDSLSDDNPLRKWNSDIIKGATMIGREPNPGPLLAGFLHDAGFVSVKEEVYRIPIGTWPRDKKLVRELLLRIRCRKSDLELTYLYMHRKRLELLTSFSCLRASRPSRSLYLPGFLDGP
jgi:hypothetical protein